MGIPGRVDAGLKLDAEFGPRQNWSSVLARTMRVIMSRRTMKKRAGGVRARGMVFMEPMLFLLGTGGLGIEHVRTFLLLVQLSDRGNWVEARGKDLAELMGVPLGTAFARLRRLKSEGLIVGTRGGYLLNGRVVFRGRLGERTRHLDEFDEAQRRQGIAPGFPPGGPGDAGEEGLAAGWGGRSAAGPGASEDGDGGASLGDPGGEAPEESGGGVALPPADGRGPGSGDDLPGGAGVPALERGDEVAVGEPGLR